MNNDKRINVGNIMYDAPISIHNGEDGREFKKKKYSQNAIKVAVAQQISNKKIQFSFT